MKSIEVSARTIEDAISDGLAKLSCSISDCKVEILQEGAKGLFGFFGSKPATVRLTLLAQEDENDDFGIDLQNSLAHEPLKPDQYKKQERPKQAKPAPRQAAEKKAPEKPLPQEKPKAPEKGKMRIASSPQVVDKPKNSEVLERFRSAPLPDSKQPQPQPQGKRNEAVRPQRAPRPRPPREEDQDSINADVPHVAIPAPEHIQMHAKETPEGIAQQFLLEVTQRMGVDVQVDVCTEEGRHLYATMYGDTLGILIGRRGETLDALQYLTSLQVNRGQEEYTRVTLDTENYRAKREEALNRLAARMASRAVKTGRKVSLEPMNPYERRILHSSLQGNPNVTTHSEGDEPYRHVVVVPVRTPSN